MSWFPLVLFTVFIGWVLYSNFTKKGSELILGGETVKTFDSLINENSFASNNIKVHLIKSSDSVDHDIVIEEISKSKLHHSSTHINLNKEQAEGLSKLLIEALDYANTET